MRFALLALGLLALACACSNGAGSIVPGAPVPAALDALASNAVPPVPPVAKFARSAHVPVVRNAPLAIPLPHGFAAALTLAPGSAVGKRTVAYIASSSIDPLARRIPAAAPLVFASLTLSNTATFAGGSTLQFTLPARYIVPRAHYFVALNDPTDPASGWQLTFTRVAKIAGSRLTLTTRSPLFLVAGTTYAFALYATYARPGAPVAATYQLAGTMKQRYVYDYPTPVPEPPVTVVTNVTENVVVRAAALPASIGSGKATDVHVAESDATRLGTTASASDAYVVPNGAFSALAGSIGYSFAAFAAQPDETTTVYSPAPLDIAPASSSAQAWSNSPQATITQSFAGGQSYVRTIAADGSYTETGTITEPSSTPQAVAIVENADGSGSYTGIFPIPKGDVHRVCEYLFGAPSGTVPSATIAIGARFVDPSPSPGATPCGTALDYATIPAWFPTAPPQAASTPPPSPALYTETDTSMPVESAPANCAIVPGTPAVFLVTRTIWRVDTIIGYSESTSILTYYTGANAIRCMTFSDSLQNYYDWNGDVQPRPYLEYDGTPISSVTTTETLSPRVSSVAGDASLQAAAPVSVAAAAQAHFLSELERRRSLLTNGGVR